MSCACAAAGQRNSGCQSGATALALALVGHPSLLHLDLSWNWHVGDAVAAETAVAWSAKGPRSDDPAQWVTPVGDPASPITSPPSAAPVRGAQLQSERPSSDTAQAQTLRGCVLVVSSQAATPHLQYCQRLRLLWQHTLQVLRPRQCARARRYPGTVPPARARGAGTTCCTCNVCCGCTHWRSSAAPSL